MAVFSQRKLPRHSALFYIKDRGRPFFWQLRHLDNIRLFVMLVGKCLCLMGRWISNIWGFPFYHAGRVLGSDWFLSDFAMVVSILHNVLFPADLIFIVFSKACVCKSFRSLYSYALLILGKSSKSKWWSGAWKISLKIAKLAHARLAQLVKRWTLKGHSHGTIFSECDCVFIHRMEWFACMSMILFTL